MTCDLLHLLQVELLHVVDDEVGVALGRGLGCGRKQRGREEFHHWAAWVGCLALLWLLRPPE